MNIHWFQHVPFEGLGCIEPWLVENGHAISCTRLWADDSFPQISNQRIFSDIDGLIVMGGPMGVYDDERYAWLADEKAFIKQIIDQGKPVLGICLGAQLIADVLGSKVWKNDPKEIGFYECSASVSLASNAWNFPTEFMSFHWHGDTFGIPDGAVHLASSEACENQAFVYNDNVLALQFHLETTEESLMALYENCSGEIGEGPFFQTLEEMQEKLPNLGTCNALMFDVLKQLFG